MSINKYTISGGVLKRVSQAIKEKGVSQADIAKKIYVTPGFVSNMLKGESRLTFQFVECLVLDYEISVDSVILGADHGCKTHTKDKITEEYVAKLYRVLRSGNEQAKKMIMSSLDIAATGDSKQQAENERTNYSAKKTPKKKNAKLSASSAMGM